MSNLNVFLGSGKIARKEYRTVGDNTVCQLTVPVNIWKPGKSGSEGTTETMWFEMSAWGRPGDKYNRAEKWNEKFDKGNYVTFQGALNFRTYDSKGETKVSFLIDNAQVDWSAGAPREASEATGDNDTPAATTGKTKSATPFFG